jgi:hypothetical protein
VARRHPHADGLTSGLDVNAGHHDEIASLANLARDARAAGKARSPVPSSNEHRLQWRPRLSKSATFVA